MDPTGGRAGVGTGLASGGAAGTAGGIADGGRGERYWAHTDGRPPGGGRCFGVVHQRSHSGDLQPSSRAAGGAGTVTFNPREATKQITLTVNGDAARESNEVFYLELISAGGATIDQAKKKATVTITNDD